MKELNVMAHRLEQQTYLPEHPDEVAKVLDFVTAHQAARGEAPTPQYFLAGSGDTAHIPLPPGVHQVLVQVLEAMNAGKAVTVAPQNQVLTTQQAADLLGVSRPTVVALIEAGELPADTPGKRRRVIKLDDLLAYRARRRDAAYTALLDSSTDYSEEPENPEITEARLRRVRAEAATARRTKDT